MQIEDILGKALNWAKAAGKIIIGALIMFWEALCKLLSRLHIGKFLSDTADGLGVKISKEKIEQVLSVIICVLLIVGLLAMCAPKKSGGGSLSLFEEDCWRCGGSGDCQECGGDSRKVEWMGDQYMDVRCTSCSGGRCSWCNGSGEE